MSSITYIEASDFTGNNFKKYLKWWSAHTLKEQRMLDRSLTFFRKNLLFAVFVIDNNKIIGAAGIIKCLDRHKKEMFFKEKMLVVELISNFIEADYRDRDIGTQLVKKRVSFAYKHNYLPVSVTGSIIMQKIFSGMAVEIKYYPEYNHIAKEVRVCECHSKPCDICPLKDKAIWVFPKI